MADKDSQTASTTPSVSTRLVGITQAILGKRNEVLEERGLQAGQDQFLLALLATDGVTMGTLSSRLGISASSATKGAIKLEALELIRRESSRVDNRQNYAFLTTKGRDLAREILEAYDALEARMFSKLKGKDAERLIKIFDRLENKAKGAGKKPKKAGKNKAGKSAKSKKR